VLLALVYELVYPAPPDLVGAISGSSALFAGARPGAQEKSFAADQSAVCARAGDPNTSRIVATSARVNGV